MSQQTFYSELSIANFHSGFLYTYKQRTFTHLLEVAKRISKKITKKL